MDNGARHDGAEGRRVLRRKDFRPGPGLAPEARERGNAARGADDVLRPRRINGRGDAGPVGGVAARVSRVAGCPAGATGAALGGFQALGQVRAQRPGRPRQGRLGCVKLLKHGVVVRTQIAVLQGG